MQTSQTPKSPINPETGVGPFAPDFSGRFKMLPPEMEFEFSNGIKIVAPGTSPRALGGWDDVIGKALDLAAEILGDEPGGGGGNGGGGSGGGGSTGCTTVIAPDGTKITVCPPSGS